MTTLALLNEPRCLDLEVFSLAAPREDAEPASTARRRWAGLVSPKGGTLAFREAAVRECLDTVAVLRAYREPLPDELWTLPRASERRMLAQVNAIVALGRSALRQVADLAIDPDVPDSGRVFAALFVLGCVAGPAWRQAMLGIFIDAIQRNPAEGAAAVEALSLAPNVEVLEGLTTLLRDERAPIRAAAVRVLSFRSALDRSDWVDAMRDDDSNVVAAAAAAPSDDVDRVHWEKALPPLLHHRSERVVRAALGAGFNLRMQAAHRRARDISRSDPGWADALHCVGLFGLRSDEDLIRAALAGPQWRLAVRAAGLLGRAALVPELVRLEPSGEVTPADRDAIVHALALVTGLPFLATEDLAAARRLWAHDSDRFDPEQRYRHGQRFHPHVLFKSLRLDGVGVAGPAPHAKSHLREPRQRTYFELVSATGGGMPRFSAYDFVERQSACLHLIERWLAASVDSHWAAGPLH